MSVLFVTIKGIGKNDCPKLKNKEKKNSKAVAANVEDDSEFALATTSMAYHSEKWILDSGCSYHVYPHEDWF